MAEISILSETQIETYKTPDRKTKQQVITYLVDGLAPRIIYLDSGTVPDAAYRIANPGKPVPADVQASGDKIRRLAIEAEISRIATAPGARKI